MPPEPDAGRLPSLRQVLIRGAAGSLGVKTAAAGLLFAAQVALARMMGGEEYGLYASVQAWVNILAVVCLFGMDISVLRFLPRYQVRAEWGLLKGFLRLAGNLHWALSLPAGGVLAAVAWACGPTAFGGWTPAFGLGAALLPLLVRMRMSGAVLQGLKHVVLAQVPELLLRPAVQVALMGALFVLDRSRATASAGMAAQWLSTALATLVLTAWVGRRLPAQCRTAPEQSDRRGWLTVSAALAVMAGCEVARMQLGVAMLGSLAGQMEAGMFAAAVGVVRLVTFGPLAVAAIAIPVISQLHASGQTGRLQRVLRMAAWAGLLYSLATGAALGLLGREALGLFSPSYVGGYACLLLLIAGRIAGVALGLSDQVMMMTEHQGPALRMQVLSLAFNVAANAALIPLWGIVGAAVASEASIVLLRLLSTLYVRRVLRMNSSVFPLGPRRPRRIER